MRDLHLLWALKESRHKWNPSVKRDRRSTTFEGDIFVARVPLGKVVCRQNISDIRFGNLREYLAHLV
jgi:hypothetical protein